METDATLGCRNYHMQRHNRVPLLFLQPRTVAMDDKKESDSSLVLGILHNKNESDSSLAGVILHDNNESDNYLVGVILHFKNESDSSLVGLILHGPQYTNWVLLHQFNSAR